MSRIVAGISTLKHHRDALAQDPERYRPVQCPHCGLGHPWHHGHYTRKADRTVSGRENPVPIPRFFCRSCGHTCSRLPSCIAPRRWYGWALQQMVLLLLWTGLSFYAIRSLPPLLDTLPPCRSTCRRWWRWLAGRSISFESALRSAFPELGRTEVN
ncbi:hypothetical protein JKG47_02035 [Acidithiobacillus sp. MC6.1]|nr:hypothetical protein [Acidithiobacillus sp. MC6.1]